MYFISHFKKISPKLFGFIETSISFRYTSESQNQIIHTIQIFFKIQKFCGSDLHVKRVFHIYTLNRGVKCKKGL